MPLVDWRSCYREATKAIEYDASTQLGVELPDSFRGHFVPEEARAHAALRMTHTTTIVFAQGETRVTLSVMHPTATLPAALQDLLLCIRFAVTMLNAAARPLPSARLYWICCDIPKVMDMRRHSKAPKRPFVLGPEHVNSGYTMRVMQHVVVYRIEEAEKVFIHELVHLWGLDALLLDDAQVDVVEKCTPTCEAPFQIQPKTHIGAREAITDAIAIIAHTAFCVAHRRIPKTRADAMTVQNEHIMNQAAKVLRIQGFKSLEELRVRPYFEDTHVCMYYVVKAALLARWRQFEKACASRGQADMQSRGQADMQSRGQADMQSRGQADMQSLGRADMVEFVTSAVTAPAFVKRLEALLNSRHKATASMRMGAF